MTYLFDDKIRYDDSANIDAFGGLRTTTSRLLGEYRYQYGEITSATEMNDYVAGNATFVSSISTNCWLARTSTTSGDVVVRQTKQYHPYISGTSNKGLMTFKMDTAKDNLVQSVGMFDDDNGIIFRLNGTTAQMVIRKAGVDNEVVNQSAWNLDRLDGSMTEYNPSGKTVDWSKAQIFCCDYQWLGVGRVRVGFVRNGEALYVHEFIHTNITTDTYMHQPSLPLRWEIRNIGSVATSSELKVICGGVYCEGAVAETGFSRAISTDGTTVTLTTGNSTTYGRGVLAIRLKTSSNGIKMRAFARLKNVGFLSDQDTQFKVAILPNTDSLSGTVTWTAVPGYGWCEYAKDFTLQTSWATTANIIDDQFATGSVNNKSGVISIQPIENRTSCIYQNYDATSSQVLVIVGYRLDANAAVRANMSWVEVK